MSNSEEERVQKLRQALVIASAKEFLYSEWPQIRESLLSFLTLPPSTAAEASSSSSPPRQPLQILVPGCCHSPLSEHLYDAGFHCITNIDVSKTCITEMLTRNVRPRPDMKWRVMDLTDMKFEDETFDTVLDNGRLDALMEPHRGPELGNMYTFEVKRVLQKGGRFLCLTLGVHYVLGRIFSKFRYGWRVSVHALPQKPSSVSGSQTFMIVAEKESSSMLHKISLSFDPKSLPCREIYVSGLSEAIKAENKYREEFSNSSDTLYTYEEIRVHEWLFSSEEGQWIVAEGSKASRLIMVFLDSNHTDSIDEIKKDLSRLVKLLEPENVRGSEIQYTVASDGVKQRKLIHQVSSFLTGTIIVDEVVYEKVADSFLHTSEEELQFRRLIFPSSQNLVQSQVSLKRKEHKDACKKERKNKHSSKSKKRGKQRRNISSGPKVDHDYLVSPYHAGIISGFVLISSYLEMVALAEKPVKATIIGLGAGMLPMFLHECLPFFQIEVVELDPVVRGLARDFFEFEEDERLMVHVGDGIQYVRNNGISKACNNRVDILVVDVDSSNSSSGMVCPAAEFVKESFLLSVKDFISEQGLFIINLLSWSAAEKALVISRMKKVFSYLYSFQIEKDVYEIIFARKTKFDIDLQEDSQKLENLLDLNNPATAQRIIAGIYNIKPLN